MAFYNKKIARHVNIAKIIAHKIEAFCSISVGTVFDWSKHLSILTNRILPMNHRPADHSVTGDLVSKGHLI
jgi:hypothetical protein